MLEAGPALTAGIGVVIGYYHAGNYNNLTESALWYEIAVDFGSAVLSQIIAGKVLKSLSGPISEYLCKNMCFEGGTLVHLAAGLQAIEKIDFEETPPKATIHQIKHNK